MNRDDVALVLSLAAFAVSAVTFWITYLRPFKLRTLHTPPRFFAYRLTAEEASLSVDIPPWWIPSFDVGATFYNTGQRPGELLDVRIRLHRLSDSGVDAEPVDFVAVWVVDHQRFRSAHHRFEWLETAVLRDWYPTLIESATPTPMHLILESKQPPWDRPVSGKFRAALEIRATDADQRWRSLGDYFLRLDEKHFEIEGAHTLAPYDQVGRPAGVWTYAHHHAPHGHSGDTPGPASPT